MRNSRTLWFWVIFTLSMVGMVVFLGRGGRDETPQGLFNPGPNGLKAWNLLMGDLGFTVSEPYALPTGDAIPDSTVLLRETVDRTHPEAFLDYVRAGGHIVTDSSLLYQYDENLYRPDVVTSQGILYAFTDHDMPLAPHCQHPMMYEVNAITMNANLLSAPPSTYGPLREKLVSTTCIPQDATKDMRAAEREALLRSKVPEEQRKQAPGVYAMPLQDPNMYGFIQTTLGKGSITMLASMDFMENKAIINHDNAVLAVRMFEGRHHIAVINATAKIGEVPGQQDYGDPYPKGANAGTNILYMAAFILTWAYLLRPGNVIHEPLLERRQAHESTVVIGEMLRVSQQYPMAAKVLQDQVCLDVVRRTGIPLDNRSEIIATLHAQTALDPALISSLLYDDVVHSNADLVLYAQSITTLRRRLNTVARGHYQP